MAKKPLPKTTPTHPAARAAQQRQPQPQKSAPKPAPKTKTKGVHQGRPVAVPDPRPAIQVLAEAYPTGTYEQYPLLADLPDLLVRHKANRDKYAALKSQVDALVEEEKAIREEMEAYLVASDIQEVTCGDYQVKQIQVRDSLGLDESFLLEHGVEADLLVKARRKVTRKGYTYVSVLTLEEAKANQEKAARAAAREGVA